MLESVHANVLFDRLLVIRSDLAVHHSLTEFFDDCALSEVLRPPARTLRIQLTHHVFNQRVEAGSFQWMTAMGCSIWMHLPPPLLGESEKVLLSLRIRDLKETRCLVL
jgi:hypothetical protein